MNQIEMDKYYTKMSEIDYYDALRDGLKLDFTLLEMRILSKYGINGIEKIHSSHKTIVLMSNIKLGFIKYDYSNVRIRKCEDEWYYIDFDYREFYKCDQFSGLIKCLDDMTC